MAASPAPRVHQWALFLAAACLLAAAAGAREAQQLHGMLEAQQQFQHGEGAATFEDDTTFVYPKQAPNQNSLLTYYYDVFKPEVQLVRAAPQAQRPGRTPLRVKLAGPAAVSAFMPVVSPDESGMTHQVVNTWAALKNYALMFSRVNAINEHSAAAGASSRLFPLPGAAVMAASDASTPKDVGRMIDAAEAQGQRRAWTETSPSSVLVMPAGQSVAAVADVMNVAYDEAAGAITLDPDLVHDPHIVSEFQPHGKQTLDASTSHFHFVPPPGVRLDAADLLKALAKSKYELPGLHVFAKGFGTPCTITVTSSAAAGGLTEVTFRKSGSCAAPGRQTPEGGPDGEAAVTPTPRPCDDLTYTIGPQTGFKPVSSTTCLIVNGGREPSGEEAGGGAGARQQAELLADAAADGGAGARQQAELLADAAADGGAGARQLATRTVGLVNGVGSILIKLLGSIVIKPISLAPNGGGVAPFVAVPANGLSLGLGASKLAIAPAKAYRHAHDSITLTALALSAGGGAAAGVTVTFAVVGDCEPVLASAKAVTDAGGRATAVISAKKPGAVAVVAAVTSTTGGTLVTPASHIIFFTERHYVEHKERHYYGGGYDDRWGEAQAYAEIKSDADSDAERFAAEANKKAIAQLAA